MEIQELQETQTVNRIIDNMNLFDDDLRAMAFDGNIRAAVWLVAYFATKWSGSP